MKSLVIVEDDAMMREELTDMLQKSGYEIHLAHTFENITNQIIDTAPNLVLLDINLPGVSGFQICREIKERSAIPVLILTSRDQMQDELHALDIGADEYLTKPCRRERLLARISNVLKRYEGRNNLLEGEDFLLDRQTYTLYIHDDSVILPKNQGKMLEAFLLSGHSLITKEDLAIAVWGTSEYIDENAVQVNLTRLKRTMSTLRMSQKIVSVRGVGYQLKQREERYET